MKKPLLYFSYLIFNFSFYSLHAQDIYTYAGNGTAAFAGDGGQASAAELTYPEGVCVDDSGNVYIADGNNAIRKVNHVTGIITTVAGTGVGGISPDGGQATSSQILQPLDVAVDDSGNIYFSETANNKIRIVTKKTGILSTIAGIGSYGFSGDGGPATAAEIFYPYGLVVDAAHDVYFADEDNYRIRKVTYSTGIINTLAGNGTMGYNNDGIQATAAELNYPTGVALDEMGNVYISDYGNHRIRMVDISNGIISTYAGDGTPGSNGDGSPATAAQLNYPAGVAFDINGNLYIADEHNNKVREVDSLTGIITTVAGNGAVGNSGDGGLAIAAELQYDYGVAVDKSGNFFIADAGNNKVREVIGIPTGISYTLLNSSIEIYPNPASDKMYVSGLQQNSLLKLYTITSQLVWSENSINNSWITEIPLSNLPNGIYFLNVQSSDGSIVTKKIEVIKN